MEVSPRMAGGGVLKLMTPTLVLEPLIGPNSLPLDGSGVNRACGARPLLFADVMVPSIANGFCASAFVAMPNVRASATPIHVAVILRISIPPVNRLCPEPALACRRPPTHIHRADKGVPITDAGS